MASSGLVERLLVALLSPGSIEAEVGKLQAALFSAHGYVSAAALPPLIPVAFLPPGDRSMPLESLGKRIPSPYIIEGSGLEWGDGSLFLSLDTGGIWEGIRAEIAEAGALFVPHEGFCLGCWEAGAADRAAVKPEVPPLRFSSCTLALISLKVAAGAEWWREVHTEILKKRPLR
jgi:hypothetical protein